MISCFCYLFHSRNKQEPFINFYESIDHLSKYCVADLSWAHYISVVSYICLAGDWVF